MTTRAEAREHVLAGGTIEFYDTEFGTIQRRMRYGQHQRRENGGPWQLAVYHFLADEAQFNLERRLVALETVKLLPIPQRVKCDNRADAVAHMNKGGVIEYQNEHGTRQRKIVGGVEYDRYVGEGEFQPSPRHFMGDVFGCRV